MEWLRMQELGRRRPARRRRGRRALIPLAGEEAQIAGRPKPPKPWPRKAFPAPPGQYQRWAGEAPTGWDWYRPKGKKKGEQYKYLGVINRMLPYMAPEDVKTLTRQLHIAAPGVYKGYLGATTPTVPPAPTVETEAKGEGSYQRNLKAIQGVIGSIPNKEAKAWASSVFDVYLDNTPEAGMRTRAQEAMFKAQLDELMEGIPESAQPYAAAMQRLVMPTVAMPAREWYEMPQEMRTAPTSWVTAAGYKWNPMWL